MSKNCKTCSTPLSRRSPGLQCSFCDESYHFECSNITKTQYDAICDMPGCVWKCTGCCGKNVANHELMKIIEKLQAIVKSLQDEIKQLKEEKKTEKEVWDTEVVINEIAERQKREKNLVFYRFEETNDDLKNVKDIIKTIAPTIQTNGIRVMRLGKPKNNKPAPLKVQLTTREEVYVILKNKRKLKDLNINISISTDQTKIQQDYSKKIWMELDHRKKKGEDNIFIKYINGIPVITNSKN